MGVKDIIDTAGLPTACGSAAYAGRVPLRDAAVVARLKSLGAVIFGKTATTEFAWREPGPTVNPHNPAHTPGGSSSGSAAAVAAGIVPLALGSQTLGSIIRPAAYCGVVGFKASFGAVPRAGVQPLAGSLDHIGFFTRGVDDARAGLQPAAPCRAGRGRRALPAAGRARPARRRGALAGLARQPSCARRSRIAPSPSRSPRSTRHWASCAPPAPAVADAELPEAFWRSAQDVLTVLQAEGARIYGPLVRDVPQRTSAHLKELVAEGRKISAVQYLEALRSRGRVARPARRGAGGLRRHRHAARDRRRAAALAYTGDPIFAAPGRSWACPRVTLPVARDAQGLPLGIQLAGFYGQDARLLRAQMGGASPGFPHAGSGLSPARVLPLHWSANTDADAARPPGEPAPPMTRSDSAPRTAHQYVLGTLRTEILQGVHAPGSRLRQEEVAQRLRVSTTPVREAFRDLQAEGLVSLGTHRGRRWCAGSPSRMCRRSTRSASGSSP